MGATINQMINNQKEIFIKRLDRTPTSPPYIKTADTTTPVIATTSNSQNITHKKNTIYKAHMIIFNQY